MTQEPIRKDVMDHVVKAVLPNELLDDAAIYSIHPTGRFVIGVDTFGTCKIEKSKIVESINKALDLRPERCHSRCKKGPASES